MKIYFATYSHSNKGLSGSDVYHHNLAKIFLSWGWEVRSLNRHIAKPFNCEGVEVYTMDEHLNNELWCDVIITHPGPHIFNRVKRRTVIIKHNSSPEVARFNNCKVLYCGKHVSEVATIPCFDSMVWHPGNRFYGTEKRGDPSGPWIMINCNENKGGQRLIQLAEAMPETQFAGILGAYGPQIRKPLQNLEYWPGVGDIGQYFEKAAGLLCLSNSEGFPTGVMEAMSHGLPIVGNSKCEGFMEVVGDTGFVSKDVDGWRAGIRLVMQKALYLVYSSMSIERATQIELSRDFESLKKFFTG